MRSRCNNSKNSDYKWYGGRGITVCAAWSSFEQFYADMGDPPSDDHEIDRKDPNGHYTPENTRWATPLTQQRNRRKHRLLTFRGTTLCMSEWAERVGLKTATVLYRLEAGWSIEHALMTTPRFNRRQHATTP